MTRIIRSNHRQPRTGRFASAWGRWVEQNRAYGEVFERWAHPRER